MKKAINKYKTIIFLVFIFIIILII